MQASTNNPRLRILDRQLAALYLAGSRHSAVLRAIGDAIEETTLIVHVVTAPYDPRKSAGRMQFVTTAGETRILRITITSGLDPVSTLGLVAHELQHALEVAADRSVRDERTFEALYQRIGFRVPTTARAAYDTHDARAVQRAVVLELASTSAFALAVPPRAVPGGGRRRREIRAAVRAGTISPEMNHCLPAFERGRRTEGGSGVRARAARPAAADDAATARAEDRDGTPE